MSIKIPAGNLVIAVIGASLLSACSSVPVSNPKNPYYTQYQQNKSGTIAKSQYSSRQAKDTLHAVALDPQQKQLQTKLISHFKKWRGTPYQWGGTSHNGIDCSAYVQRTMDDVFDIRLPRTTDTQIETGLNVRKRNLKVGDIVFFKTSRTQLHNGVYLGEGKFMHSSSSQGVMISSITDDYWKNRFHKAKRVI